MRRSFFFAVGLAVAIGMIGSAQQVGPNVNVLSGVDPLTGSPSPATPAALAELGLRLANPPA